MLPADLPSTSGVAPDPDIIPIQILQQMHRKNSRINSHDLRNIREPPSYPPLLQNSLLRWLRLVGRGIFPWSPGGDTQESSLWFVSVPESKSSKYPRKTGWMASSPEMTLGCWRLTEADFTFNQLVSSFHPPSGLSKPSNRSPAI